VLLNAVILARAVYELGYELHHRPDWVWIPLQGILQLVGPEIPRSPDGGKIPASGKSSRKTAEPVGRRRQTAGRCPDTE
jgi:hypothetical protein